MATKEQIKRIYGLGAGLGIVGKDKDDMLHELIFSITGKDSVKQLDDSEFKAVQAELINRMKLADPNHLLHNTKSRNKKKEAEESAATVWLRLNSSGCAGDTATGSRNLTLIQSQLTLETG